MGRVVSVKKSLRDCAVLRLVNFALFINQSRGPVYLGCRFFAGAKIVAGVVTA